MRLTAPVRAVFGLEIRSLLRDPRTLLVSVVLPVVLLPGLLLAGAWMGRSEAERQESRVFRVAVTGSEAAFATGLLEEALDAGGEGFRFRLVSASDPIAALEADSVDLVLEALTEEEWGREVAAGREPEPAWEFAPERILRIRYHSSHVGSRLGADRMRAHLLEVREVRRDRMILEAGFPVAPERVAAVEPVDVATGQQVEGAQLGRFLTLIIVGLMILGGSAVATDTLAGEKERGTLTTLLTSAARRSEIVTGKLLAVMAVGFAIALIQVVNLWVFLGLGVVEPPPGLALEITPEMAVVLLFILVPIVALSAGVLLLASAYANSYKEAQLYLTPVLLGMALPTLAPLLPDVSLRSVVIVVPLANLSLAVRDLLLGDLGMGSLAGAWIVTAAAAGLVTARSVRALQDEGVVTGDTSREEFLKGPALFRRRVVLWFLVLWAVKLLVDLNLPFTGIRATSLVSVGLVFGLFPLLVVRYFRLDPVRALALRRPRPAVWPAVLLGVPGGLLTAQAVFRLADRVLPMPVELIERLGQALMPEGIPLWQLFLLLAVVPAIVEELTFRGVLVYGLVRRVGPVALCLVVGLVFGFFHFQLFRIPATALLGVVLTAVTLMTGSIFPAMLWHTLNNGLAIYLGSRGVETLGQGALGATAGVVLLALALWIIWANRTPHAGLRTPPTLRSRAPT